MKKLCVFALVLSLSFLAAPSFAQTFGVDGPGHTSTPTLTSDDLYAPSGISFVPPSTVFPGVGGINVNAISYGHDLTLYNFDSIDLLYFSVDRSSLGVFGSGVNEEATPGFGTGGIPGAPTANNGQAGDIYAGDFLGASGLPFGNVVEHDDNGLRDDFSTANPAPGAILGLWNGGGGAPTPLADNLDSLDMRSSPPFTGGIPPSIFFSIDLATVPAGLSSADIYVGPQGPGYDATSGTPPPPTLYAAAPALGLVPTDDVDAVVVFERDLLPGFNPGSGDIILFSLARGSTSLGALGATPDDVLIASAAGTAIFADGSTFGLAGASDNLNALDVRISPIPEPATAVFMLLGLALVRRIRNNRRHA